MANVYDSQGNYEKALEYYGKALTIKLASLGDKHPSTAQTWFNIGLVYENRKMYADALGYYRKAHTVFLEAFGPDHPHTKLVAQGIRRAEQGIATTS